MWSAFFLPTFHFARFPHFPSMLSLILVIGKLHIKERSWHQHKIYRMYIVKKCQSSNRKIKVKLSFMDLRYFGFFLFEVMEWKINRYKLKTLWRKTERISVDDKMVNSTWIQYIKKFKNFSSSTLFFRFCLRFKSFDVRKFYDFSCVKSKDWTYFWLFRPIQRVFYFQLWYFVFFALKT